VRLFGGAEKAVSIYQDIAFNRFKCWMVVGGEGGALRRGGLFRLGVNLELKDKGADLSVYWQKTACQPGCINLL